jgi:hypothetical protein
MSAILGADPCACPATQGFVPRVVGLGQYLDQAFQFGYLPPWRVPGIFRRRPSFDILGGFKIVSGVKRVMLAATPLAMPSPIPSDNRTHRT